MFFSKKLISWYLINKRSLPWRVTKDPYHIWLSEIILQQTRVDQGIPYYLIFIEEFPNVFELAKASEEKVLKLWQGLGYYSRARNLHAAARTVASEYNGVFPTSYKSLLQLKGVGEYTAAAIASICYGQPVAVVDGNVYRVLSRVFGLDIPIDATEGKKIFRSKAEELLDTRDPATYNQALMEFGALQCTPKQPKCHNCPFSESCVAFNQNLIAALPVKLKKQKIQKRHFNYLVFISEDGRTLMQQRRGKGIWKGLYEFPLVETAAEASAQALAAEEATAYNLKPGINMEVFNSAPIVHKLSHQHIHAKFWIVSCANLPEEAVSTAHINKLPVPVLIANFIDTFGF